MNHHHLRIDSRERWPGAKRRDYEKVPKTGGEGEPLTRKPLMQQLNWKVAHEHALRGKAQGKTKGF